MLIEKTTQDFILASKQTANERMLEVFQDYLTNNFTINKPHKIYDILQSSFKEINNLMQNDNLLRMAIESEKYSEIFIEQIDKDMWPKNKIWRSKIPGKESIKSLGQLIEKVVQNYEKAGVIMTKIGLQDKMANYEEFDIIDEDPSYKTFASYGIEIGYEGTDMDFHLGNTILARYIFQGNTNMLEKVISNFMFYTYHFITLQREINLEEQVDIFYSNKQNELIHIDDALPVIVQSM